MTATLFDTIRGIVHEEVLRVRSSALAVVEDVHPHAGESDKDNYACTVRLRDTGLVLRKVPVATWRIGAVSIPEPGELVVVQFVGGDLHTPVVTGRLYDDQDRPPPNDRGQAVLHLPVGAADGDAVHVELHSGDRRELVVKLGDGLALHLRDDDPVIEVDAGGGQATLTIDRDGTVSIKSGASLKIEATEVTIEASGALKLKGATIDLN
jgi:phage baseplate assembly protein gpV